MPSFAYVDTEVLCPKCGALISLDKIRFKKCVDYDTFYSGSHLSTPNAQAYSSGNDGQREAAQADQDAYP